VIDENSAPRVPIDVGTRCYQCPSTTCDGHLYMVMAQLGRELSCPKCGLIVTIGHHNTLDATAMLEEAKFSRSWFSSRTLFFLLLGVLLGILMDWSSTHPVHP
jgi:hypothetical protein